MMPESSERVFIVGGPRVSVSHALEFLVNAMCEFIKAGDTDTWGV
jgi:hypothetical protein